MLCWVTVAPITSTIRGLTSEVSVGVRNGLDHDIVVSCHDATTLRQDAIGDTSGCSSMTRSRRWALALAVSDASNLFL